MNNRIYTSAKGQKILYDDLLAAGQKFTKAQPKTEEVQRAQKAVEALRMTGFIPPEPEPIVPEKLTKVKVSDTKPSE